jgi:hypothetical protein
VIERERTNKTYLEINHVDGLAFKIYIRFGDNLLKFQVLPYVSISIVM